MPNDSRRAQANNIPLPLERSPPGSFKRLLGRTLFDPIVTKPPPAGIQGMNVAWRGHSRQAQAPTGHSQADECAYSAPKDDADKAASRESRARRDITFAGAH